MMTRSEQQPLLTTAALLVIAAVAAAAALWWTRPVMVPFVLAVFITYLVSPVVDFLQVRWRVHKYGAVFLALLVAAGLLTLIGMLVVTSTQGLLQNFDVYQDRVISFAVRVAAVGERFGLEIGRTELVQGIRQLPVASWLQRGAGTAVGFVTNFVLVMIFVVYLLLGRQPQRLRRGIYREIDEKVRNYIVIKFAVSATTGVLVGTILTLFGLDLALVIGVMAFLLNFIPSIGSIVATLLPLPVALVQYDSGLAIFMVVALPGVVQFMIGNVIEPLVMGEGLDLHPVVILMALVFWGILWGVVGMLLAVPITAVLRIVFARVAITAPIADLLAGRLPKQGAITAETLIPPEAE